jgi:DNA-binding MarR family transcriptional regulator
MSEPADENATGYRLEEQVGFLLRRATQRHLAIFARHLPEFTPTQFAALAKLCELGEASQNALGRAVAMDAATIKGVVDRLRKRGRIAARPDPEDSRRLLLCPSEAGRETLARIVSHAVAITEETLSPLSPAQQQSLLALLNRMV